MSASQKIDEHIAGYQDWRGDLLVRLRNLINDTDSSLEEDFKWGVPVWKKKGLICAISGFKDHVKMNFFKGAQIEDPAKLFNSGLDSKDHRSINFAEDSELNEKAIKDLILNAIKID